MRSAAITGTALVALLALAGCGGNDEPAEAQEADTGAQADAEAPAETEPAEEPEQESGGIEEGVASEDMDLSDDPILGDRDFTGRMTGDVTAVPGEPVEIDQGAFEGVGDYMGTVTLSELVGAPVCNLGPDEVTEPVNGQFIYATFTLAADVDAPEEFSISDSDFRWDGLDAEIATYDTFTCMDDANGLQDDIRQGESAERILIFDVPEFEGTLIYRGATHYVEWEISRDDYTNADRLP